MRITHGRGITDSTLTKLVHALPRSISICDALEQFTGVHTITSEQYKDLCQSTQARDARDRYMFVECCMHIHRLLDMKQITWCPCQPALQQMTVSTLENAIEICQKATTGMTEKKFSESNDVVMKR